MVEVEECWFGGGDCGGRLAGVIVVERIIKVIKLIKAFSNGLKLIAIIILMLMSNI